jgi:hypothetical protein
VMVGLALRATTPSLRLPLPPTRPAPTTMTGYWRCSITPLSSGMLGGPATPSEGSPAILLLPSHLATRSHEPLALAQP